MDPTIRRVDSGWASTPVPRPRRGRRDGDAEDFRDHLDPAKRQPPAADDPRDATDDEDVPVAKRGDDEAGSHLDITA